MTLVLRWNALERLKNPASLRALFVRGELHEFNTI
jgi:hypothetical protein